MQNMTRRSFVGTAGTGALVGASSLTASATMALAADGDTSTSQDWLGEEPSIDDSQVKAEYAADVVVVGVSDAGAVAVRSAVEAGASVVAIEKGDSVHACGSDIYCPGSKLQERYDRVGAVDYDEVVKSHQAECLHQTKEQIFRRYLKEFGEVFDWILEADPDVFILDTIFDDVPDENAANYLMPNRYPMALEDYDYHMEAIPTFPGTLKFPALSTLTTMNYDKACEEGDVQGLFGYAGRKLIMEDGRCVGIYAEDLTDGGYVKVTANKGVVLATGDYKDNPAMLDAFTPRTTENGNGILSLLSDVNGEKADTGDGHKMGAWAGARLQDGHAVMIHHMGGGAGPDGRGVMGVNGYLQLNLGGERFMNEDIPGQQLENQIEMLRERTSYQFFDSAWPEQCKYFPEGHGVVLYCLDEDEVPKNHPTNTNWRTKQDVQDAVDSGRCYMADTIEELLAQIPDIDQETAKASIERYNEVCHSGKDEDFGKEPTRLFALENPPFYACALTPALNLANMDGLESDEDCHTFDQDRNVIPGLYAAGNVQGNRFALQYPISTPGCSVGLALFYGYVAGKNAAMEA